MTFVNPDNPDNNRTIESFDMIGIAGDVTHDEMYINFLSDDPSNPSQKIVEGSLFIQNFQQLKNLATTLNRAVEQIDSNIGR